MYLSRKERARAIEAAVEASGNKPVLAGIGDLRIDRVIEHTASAVDAGASALLLAPVSYLPLTERDFTELVKTIASGTSLPLCLYNNPGTTHFTMTAELVANLAKLPTVEAVKNPAPLTLLSASKFAAKRTELPEGFYHGVFAPNSKHRSLITPAQRGKGKLRNPAQLQSACIYVDEYIQLPTKCSIATCTAMHSPCT